MATVLYIAGSGRSGSTLLAAVLGQSPGVVDVGELWKIWRVREEHGRRCGCGLALTTCPFWLEVSGASPGIFDLDDTLLSTLERLGRARSVVRLQGELWTHRRDVTAYVKRLARLYEAIAEVAHARVIVDNSKMPGPALAVESIAGLDVRVLHLTRDPRAVAASWQTRKEDVVGGHHLEVRGPREVARAWMTRAIGTETLVRARATHYRRISYERFATEPEIVVDEVLHFVGEATGSPAFVGPGKVVLEPTHSTGGNPSRFERYERQIVSDDRWHTELDSATRRKVEWITTPVRQYVGYS